jgi:serine phosphatase RsbU (regulator of sigma subunit)/pSer/pThr/pTyr-binding forkhead associated (FHA) protein
MPDVQSAEGLAPDESDSSRPGQAHTAAAQLAILRDLRFVRNIALHSDVLTIGRSPQCNIVLDHRSVSRSHARLERRGNRWFVVDDQSTNGVCVNGVTVAEGELRSGDLVEIRPFALNFHSADAASTESMPLATSEQVTTAASAPKVPTTTVRRRLNDLYALARWVVKRSEHQTLWPSMLAELERCLCSDRCLLIGFDLSGGLYRVTARARPSDETHKLDVSRAIIEGVIASGRGVLLAASESHASGAAIQGSESETGSALCLPIVVAGQTRAVLYADRWRSQRPFRADDLEFATAAMELAAAAVELDELHDRARELAHMHGRLEAAREIQEFLFPTPLPQPAWGTVESRNIPAEQVSGDTYGVTLDENGQLLTWLADVAGKGVPAAFLTAILHSTLRMCRPHERDLHDVFCELNAAIVTQSPLAAFVTLVMCRWSPDGRNVEIANAGHPAPLWLKADGEVTAFPEQIGQPLGIVEPWAGEIVRYDAPAAISMMIYSDGAVDAHRADADDNTKEYYGEQRLRRDFAECARLSAGSVIDTISSKIRSFCLPGRPADDLTFLVVRRNRTPA